MSVQTTLQAWRQKVQQNSSSWGSLFLWVCGAGVLIVIMLFFAHR